MGKHKQRADNNIKPARQVKIQVSMKKTLPERIVEAATKLNEFAGPGLQQLETDEGRPASLKAGLHRLNITKNGMLNLWYEVSAKG